GRAIRVYRVMSANGHPQRRRTGSGIHSLRKVAFEVTLAVESEDADESRGTCERAKQNGSRPLDGVTAPQRLVRAAVLGADLPGVAHNHQAGDRKCEQR